MLRRDISRLLIIACSLLLRSHQARHNPTRAEEQANVVLILMDDLGYGDIGSYG